MVLATLSAALWAMTATKVEAQAPAVLDEFQGIRFQQYPGTASTPPDISGAVGEDGILEVVNVSAVYFPKVGGVARQPFWNISLAPGGTNAFPTSTSTFDPRAFYDAATKRFFFIILDIDNAAKKSWVHIAVSKNSHPIGMVNPMDADKRLFDPTEWHRYRYDLTRTIGDYDPESPGGADYPTLAVDGRAMYITVNYFNIADAGGNRKFDGRLDEAAIFTFDKPTLIAGTGAAADGSAPPQFTPHKYFPSNTDGSIQPAMQYPPSPSPNDAWFISLDQDLVDTFLDSYFIGFPGGSTVTTDDDQTSLDDRLIPDPAPQPGGAKPLDQLADRMQSAVRDNQGFMTAVFVSEADDESRSVIRVVKVRPQPGETVLAREWTLDAGPGLWNTLPAIAINSENCICVTWTASGATANPSIYVACTGPDQEFTALPRKILTSFTPYFGTGRESQNYARWGDYAHASVDPVDGAFWICQEYAYDNSENGWGTRWAKVSPLEPPIIVQQPHVTTLTNSVPQFGVLSQQGETGPPIRTIKVCQGQQLFLTNQVTDSAGQPFNAGWATIDWEFNRALVPDFHNQPAASIESVSLSHQGRYRFIFTDKCGVRTFSEEIFLDVVLPPKATINTDKLYALASSNVYFEVTPDPASLVEMDTLTYTWNRLGHIAFLDGKVQAFVFRDNPITAAAADGIYTCTVSNLCGSIQLSGDLIAGPRISSQPSVSGSPTVCGPAVVLSVAGTGVRYSGPQNNRRPDFPAQFYNYDWSNHVSGWTGVTWRKNGVPITLGGRIESSAPFDAYSALTINQPDYEDEGLYDCIVKDDWNDGRAVTSLSTQLILEPLIPPSLTVVSQTGPDRRFGAGMVYDSKRGKVVMFGGIAFGNNPRNPSSIPDFYASNDSWEWDGKTWEKRQPITRPPALEEFSMDYDSHRGRTVIFGGFEYSAPDFPLRNRALSNKVWEWDGNNWREAPSESPSPIARTSAAICFDSVRREMLIIGGDQFNPTPAAEDYRTAINQLWAWNGLQWSPRAILPEPAEVSSVPMSPNAFAFDAYRGKAVMFSPFFDPSNPVWEWDGAVWNRIEPTLPMTISDSRYAKAFYDPYRHRIGLTLDNSLINNAPGAEFGKSSLLYWDGAAFIRGDLDVINEIDGILPAFGLYAPSSNQGDLTAFDLQRRCLVWQDNPDLNHNSGPPSTREMHFSGKVKTVHLPVQVTLSPGGGALSVIAAGLRPMTYQWFRDGVAIVDDIRISGATSATLTFTGSMASDAGSYTAHISNGHNTLITEPISVTSQGSGLSIVVQGMDIILTWPGNSGVLQTSTTLENESWTPLSAATSPHVTQIGEPRRFFRVRFP